MNIAEYAPYIQGKEFLGELKKSPVRLNESLYKEAFEEIGTQIMFVENIMNSNTPKHFFELYPDIASRLQKNLHEEIFYAIKGGRFSESVPSIVLYALDLCEKYGSMNLFPLLFTEAQLRRIFSKGYFADGITLQDVIRSNYQKGFEPVTEWKPMVNSMTEGFKDIFIEKENMIAIVSNELAANLSKEDISLLEVHKGKLHVDKEVSIFRAGGMVGASNSIYDLRNAL